MLQIKCFSRTATYMATFLSVIILSFKFWLSKCLRPGTTHQGKFRAVAFMYFDTTRQTLLQLVQKGGAEVLYLVYHFSDSTQPQSFEGAVYFL
jgi:hypothetical protein